MGATDSITTLDSELNTEGEAPQPRRRPRDVLFHKLLGYSTPGKIHDAVIRPLFQELYRKIRPYLWFLLGIYLSLVLPILILVGLLIHAHGHIIQLSSAKTLAM
jgi:hypothetical protein